MDYQIYQHQLHISKQEATTVENVPVQRRTGGALIKSLTGNLAYFVVPETYSDIHLKLSE